MILYHFCQEKDMKGILRKGICKGVVTTTQDVAAQGKEKFRYVFHEGWQWLTLDGEKEHQSWNTHVLLDYDRTEYRFTVDVPDRDAETQIYDGNRLEEAIPGAMDLFKGWDGNENWRVYRGPIPKKWLVKLEKWNRWTKSWETMPM